MQLLRDTIGFLMRLVLLQLAQLAVVFFCAAEVLSVVVLWIMAIWWWSAYGHPSAMLLPVGASLLLYVQYAVWQYAWLRLARRGGRWRAVAEVFTVAVRHPVVRTPHLWE